MINPVAGRHIRTVRLVAGGQIEVTLYDRIPVTMSPRDAVELAKSLNRIAKPQLPKRPAGRGSVPTETRSEACGHTAPCECWRP